MSDRPVGSSPLDSPEPIDPNMVEITLDMAEVGWAVVRYLDGNARIYGTGDPDQFMTDLKAIVNHLERQKEQPFYHPNPLMEPEIKVKE